jgi:hypothetical protein
MQNGIEWPVLARFIVGIGRRVVGVDGFHLHSMGSQRAGNPLSQSIFHRFEHGRAAQIKFQESLVARIGAAIPEGFGQSPLPDSLGKFAEGRSLKRKGKLGRL